jgi:hypothetical protein
LGRSRLPGLAHLLDVFHRGRHHEGRQGVLAFSQSLDHLADEVHIGRIRDLLAAEQLPDDQPVEDRDAQFPPGRAVVGGDLIHAGFPLGGDPHERPGLIAGGVQPDRALLVVKLDLGPHLLGRLRPLPHRPRLETVAELGGQIGGGGHGRLGKQPMGGEHEQPGVGKAHQHHEHEVGRVIGRQRLAAMLLRPRLGHLVAVVAGRFVAVMAVGDKHRLRPHEPGHLGRHRLVGDRPHHAPHTEMVGGFHGRLTRHRLFEQFLHLTRRVGIEPKHLAEVGLAGPRQQQPVLLRARHRLLMRMDIAGAKPLHPHPRHEPAADMLLPLHLEFLVVDIQGRGRLLHDHPFIPPLLQELCGPGVLIGLVIVARLLAVELQPHHIGRVLFVELRLQGGVDHVIRWGDHLREVADVLGVVAEAAERGDRGHDDPCDTGADVSNPG